MFLSCVLYVSPIATSVFETLSLTLRVEHRWSVLSEFVPSSQIQSMRVAHPGRFLHFCSPEEGSGDDFRKVVVFKEETETMDEVQKNSRKTPKILGTSNEFRLSENELW
jgi:hypothetical protein